MRIINTAKPLAIRLFRAGCANRPFYHVVVIHPDKHCTEDPIEQLGVYDPLPNENGERLLSLNIDRFKHYVAEGAWVRSTVAMLLGSAGVLPIHPHCFTLSYRQRKDILENQESSTDEKTETAT